MKTIARTLRRIADRIDQPAPAMALRPGRTLARFEAQMKAARAAGGKA